MKRKRPAPVPDATCRVTVTWVNPDEGKLQITLTALDGMTHVTDAYSSGHGPTFAAALHDWQRGIVHAPRWYSYRRNELTAEQEAAAHNLYRVFGLTFPPDSMTILAQSVEVVGMHEDGKGDDLRAMGLVR